jgi:hypothetical protein
MRSAKEIEELLAYLTDDERSELAELLSADTRPWFPLAGPQLMAYDSPADIIGFGGSAGGGKGLALGTPIPTPRGWSAMADLSIGDQVFDDQGQPCTVTAVSGVNKRPCYRLVFDDGSEIVADDVHRWVTFDVKELGALTRHTAAWRERRRASRPSRATTGRKLSEAFYEAQSARVEAKPPPTGTMRSTSDIAASLSTQSGRRNHAIRVAGALQTKTSQLSVPAYTLGAWLGDGSSANGQLHGIDEEIWQRVALDGFPASRYEGTVSGTLLGLKPKLQGLGVLANKHIPPAYLRASYDDRLALLQGLMDTDGHATVRGACEFDNTNERLVDDVLELVLSLGIKATKTKGSATLDGRRIGDKWRVKFSTTLPVFSLPRKLSRISGTTKRRTTGFRYVVSCEPIESVPTKCIAVDSPTRQYLAGKAMIPTHNTDLACGKALTQHQKCMVLRRVGTELTGIIDRLTEIIGTKDGYNGQDKIWRTTRFDGKPLQIEFGALPNLGDERKYQGRPHDLLIFDEASNFLESQVRFLMGWIRSVDPDQKCQALLTFNPPTSAEGRWIVDFFGPWVDVKHPLYPTAPGQLRYAAMIPDTERGTSKDIWVEGPEPFVMAGKEPCYDFDPQAYAPTDVITPKSRTFIPSSITDNPYLCGTGYMSTLQALPEPLRSQMLNGDFAAGMEDDPWQVIPTAWVDAAMSRWRPMDRKPTMDSVGVDVARGGKDNTVIARRHDNWFDELIEHAGTATPNGPMTAGLVLSAIRDHAPTHIDVIGVGASPYDFLNEAGIQVLGINVSEKSLAKDKSGRLGFVNLRSELWWKMREMLDPESNHAIALPDDKALLAELCAPKWSLKGALIYVESRDEIVGRIGRSPDRATAIILAAIETPRLSESPWIQMKHRVARDYDPIRLHDQLRDRARGAGYDPLDNMR